MCEHTKFLLQSIKFLLILSFLRLYATIIDILILYYPTTSTFNDILWCLLKEKFKTVGVVMMYVPHYLPAIVNKRLDWSLHNVLEAAATLEKHYEVKKHCRIKINVQNYTILS